MALQPKGTFGWSTENVNFSINRGKITTRMESVHCPPLSMRLTEGSSAKGALRQGLDDRHQEKGSDDF